MPVATHGLYALGNGKVWCDEKRYPLIAGAISTFQEISFVFV